jgi:hypothetical protein
MPFDLAFFTASGNSSAEARIATRVVQQHSTLPIVAIAGVQTIVGEMMFW